MPTVDLKEETLQLKFKYELHLWSFVVSLLSSGFSATAESVWPIWPPTHCSELDMQNADTLLFYEFPVTSGANLLTKSYSNSYQSWVLSIDPSGVLKGS